MRVLRVLRTHILIWNFRHAPDETRHVVRNLSQERVAIKDYHHVVASSFELCVYGISRLTEKCHFEVN